MKKIIYSILFTALSATVVFAQDEEAETMTADEPAVESKKEGGCCGDCDFFPKEGDIGLGINAEPFFHYLGDFIGGGGANTGGLPGTNNALSGSPIDWRGNGATNGIFVRYFLADDMAVRATFQTTQFNSVSEANVQLDAVYDADGNIVTQADRTENPDKLARSFTDFDIGVGVEMRRGKGRLQGYYGGEVVYTRNNSDRRFYEYGNEMNSNNYNPTSTNFGNFTRGDGSFGSNIIGGGTERVLESAQGTSAGVRLSGILGLEFFVAKRISLGSEVQWGYSYSKTKNDGYMITERMENGERKVEQFDTYNAGNKTYGFFPSADAQIWLNMYF